MARNPGNVPANEAFGDIVALFLRRGEYEVLCLDKRKARPVGRIPVIIQDEWHTTSHE